MPPLPDIDTTSFPIGSDENGAASQDALNKAYVRVMRDLRLSILSGGLSPGERLPSQSELTGRYRVSQPTLQRAINQLVDEGFLISKPRVGVYVHHFPPHTSRYALILPRSARNPDSIASLFFDNLLHAAITHHEQHQDGIEFQTINLPMGVEEKHKLGSKFSNLLREVEQHRYAGLFYVGGARPMMQHPTIVHSGIPQVLLGGEDKQYHCVALQSYKWIDLAAQRIHDEKRTRVAVIGVSGSQARQAINASEVPIKVPPRWDHTLHIENASEAVNLSRLLLHGEANQRPDALIISDDNLTEYVLAGVLASGVSVPDELLILSHANFPQKPRQLLPVTHLGYSANQVIETAIALCLRVRGDARAHQTIARITPHFENQTEQAVQWEAG